jgi:hypothetical protein
MISPISSTRPLFRIEGHDSARLSVRSQAAVVRALLDHLEDVSPCADSALPIREQCVEEMTRLALRLLESAAALSKETDAERASADHSGVHPIVVSTAI